MKKGIAILLALVLLLGLTACNKEEKEMMERKAALYDQYAEIINALEEKQFNHAISEVSRLYWADKLANEGPRQPLEEKMMGTWYLYNQEEDEQAPAVLAIQADGNATLDGETYTWVRESEEQNGDWLHCYLLKDGVYTYGLAFNSYPDAPECAYVELRECEMEEWGPTMDDWIAAYRSNPHLKTLRAGWNRLIGSETMSGWLNFETNGGYYMYGNDQRFAMEITSEATAETLSFKLTGVEGTEAVLAVTMEQKDGHYVLNMTDEATGETAFYYNEEVYGYEETWEEYRYAQLMKKLNDYVDWGEDFYVGDEYYQGNAARKYLYEQFTELKDFRDCADYLARFAIVEDVLSKYELVRIDKLNNEDRDTLFSIGYAVDGKFASVYDDDYDYNMENYGIYTSSRVYLTYDAAGKLSGATVGTGDNVNAVCTPTYGENGKLATMHTQWGTSTDLVTFTYDDQGRVVELTRKVDDQEKFSQVYTYTYNDDGTVAQSVCVSNSGDYTTTVDYTYENGILTEMVETYGWNWSTKYVDHYVYTNDAQNRPVSAEITREPESDYNSEKLEYTYDDIYFFDVTDLKEE